jgi:hypothetical protein
MRPSNGASWRASRHAAWAVFWGEADLKPHLVRLWKHNERAVEPEIFDREVRALCECYAEALHLHEEGVHLMSTDEKSGMQALERLHPSLAMRPSPLVERQEHEYVRHGTRCLFANLEVATGRVIAPSINTSEPHQ